MEAQIKEKKVLEFKALTMSPGVFKQLRSVSPDALDGKNWYKDKFIGWVQDADECEWFIGKGIGTLLRVNRTNMWEYAASLTSKLSTVRDVVNAIDEIRGVLPQIFLK